MCHEQQRISDFKHKLNSCFHSNRKFCDLGGLCLDYLSLYFSVRNVVEIQEEDAEGPFLGSHSVPQCEKWKLRPSPGQGCRKVCRGPGQAQSMFPSWTIVVTVKPCDWVELEGIRPLSLGLQYISLNQLHFIESLPGAPMLL